MGVEDQKEEREVLDSIFPDEITDISDNAYRISVTLDVPGDPQDEDAIEPPTLWLNVTYPEAYPDVGPHLDVTAPPNATKHPQFDIAKDKMQLLDALHDTIEDNLGMAMVFTLVTTLKDAAEVLISDRLCHVEEAREILVREKEEEENRKFHGALVNREKFLEWRENFRREMEEKETKTREEEEAEDKKKRAGKPEEKKLTGKQLWEKGLVGKVEDEEEIDGEDAVAAMAKLNVTPAHF